MTWILLIATAGLLGMLAVSCRRAQLEAAEKLCDRLGRPDARLHEPRPNNVVPLRRPQVRSVDGTPSGLRPAG